jgi:hypothetical protein
MPSRPDDYIIRPERERTAIETLRSMATGSIDAIEAAARQVITVTAILLGVYYHASGGKDLGANPVSVRLVVMTPVVCWIASLICSGVALHPRSWRVRVTSEKDAEEDVERIRKHKYYWYMWAVSLLVLGAACLLLVMASRLNLLPYRFEAGS